MTPTKNRYYCISSQRIKMAFATEAKAMNFIKFNAEKIAEESGRAPDRAYFCVTCNAWHLTSKPISEREEQIHSRNAYFAEKAKRSRDVGNGRKTEAKRLYTKFDRAIKANNKPLAMSFYMEYSEFLEDLKKQDIFVKDLVPFTGRLYKMQHILGIQHR